MTYGPFDAIPGFHVIQNLWKMAEHTRRAQSLLVVTFCLVAIFIDQSTSRHVGSSCVGCHGDRQQGDDDLSALAKFWMKVQAATIDAERQLGMDRKAAEASSVNRAVIGAQQGRSADDRRANTRPIADDESVGIIADLTARVAALEKKMADAVSEGERMESEVTELSSVTDGPPLPRHLRRHVEHLQQNVGTLEAQLEYEQDKIRRYEEELALVIGKQTSLEEKLEHLESLLSFRSLVSRGNNARHKKSSRSHDSLWSPSGHRGDISQGATREEKVILEQDPTDLEDFYEYDEYDYDYTHEAKGQR
ncbi:PREDICTED: uncharacterized protein LOC109463108 [Branchiostoma belcheri]|uniref:Uncharacterized protein LOC109463108 n=1 Tax=Branchiostoma belcheri TaxID=7741 RepID=A0A6P4XY38_BRABE|nr:PREDICTED: uncharacterized protein LOC109463108 [Branchiostoma belcheri]